MKNKDVHLPINRAACYINISLATLKSIHDIALRMGEIELSKAECKELSITTPLSFREVFYWFGPHSNVVNPCKRKEPNTWKNM